IDLRLQQLAESLLDETLARPEERERGSSSTGGCLIALDVWTGDILAMASAPRPHLPELVRPDVETWNRLVHDPRNPLFPRATRMALPAGSVFKVVTAVAALESGQISPTAVLHCRGYLDEPDRHRCLIFRRHGI